MKTTKSKFDLERLTTALTENRAKINAGFQTLKWEQMKVLMSEGLMLTKEIDKYYKEIYQPRKK